LPVAANACEQGKTIVLHSTNATVNPWDAGDGRCLHLNQHILRAEIGFGDVSRLETSGVFTGRSPHKIKDNL
jgi:hypothetical protein